MKTDEVPVTKPSEELQIPGAERGPVGLQRSCRVTNTPTSCRSVARCRSVLLDGRDSGFFAIAIARKV